MSSHALPDGVDQARLDARLRAANRPASRRVWGDAGLAAVEFTPDLSPAEATTLAGWLDEASPPSAEARALVVQTAQSAVGVRYDQLTAAQVRALFACVLWAAGGLTATGHVRPLAAWLRD